MYADRVLTGTKRSIQDRLNGNLGEDNRRSRPANGKRLRQSDDKWKHDLYEDVGGPQVSKAEVGSKDLRLKLQKKVSHQANQSGKELGIRDLREKLSGTMSSQLRKTEPPKAKPVPESAKPVQKTSPAAEETVPTTKKISAPASTRKQSQQKSDLSVDGLLKSLGLEKYSIIFQAEEVDMQALMHMTDEDLKALGVPMGPRKKILLALDSRA